MANPSIQIDLIDQASAGLKKLESNIIRFVGAVSASLAAIEFSSSFITEASKFELELANVRKTTDFTKEDVSSLGESFLEMAKEVGVAAADLASIGAIAGQLGLGDKGSAAIAAFTESVAIAQNALEITSEAAAEAGAQISSIFKLPIDQVDKLFSGINEVSNQTVASATDLIDIIKRVGNAAGATLPQVTALAGAAKDLGIPNEQAGTFLVKALSNMLAEAKKFAAAMNVSTESWVTTLKTDPLEAFKLILTRLSQLQGGVREELTKKLFGSGRLFAAADKFINDAANGFTILNKSVIAADESFSDGRSAAKEYAIVMDTLNKQVEKLEASFNALQIQTGQQLIPGLKDIVKTLTETLNSPQVAQFFSSWGEALNSFLQVVKSAFSTLSEFSTEIKNLIHALGLFIGFKVATGVIGIFLSAIGGVATSLLSAGTAVAGFISIISRLPRLFILIANSAAPLTRLIQVLTILGVSSGVINTIAVLGNLAASVRALGAAIAGTRLVVFAADLISMAVSATRAAGIMAAVRLSFIAVRTAIIAVFDAAVVGGITGALAAIRAAFVGFFVFVARNPLLIIVTTAILALTVFRDKLAEIFGFISKEQDKAASAAAAIRAKQEKERQAAIKAGQDAIKRQQARALGAKGTAPELSLNTIQAEESVKSVENVFSQLTDQVADSGLAVKGLETQLKNLKDERIELNLDVKLNNLSEQRKGIEEQLKKLEPFERIPVQAKRIEELKSQLSSVVKEEDLVNSKIKEIEEAEKSVTKQLQEQVTARAKANEALATLPDVQVAGQVAELILKYKEAAASAEEFGKKVEEANSKVIELSEKPFSIENEAEIDKAKSDLRELQLELDKANKQNVESVKSLQQLSSQFPLAGTFIAAFKDKAVPSLQAISESFTEIKDKGVDFNKSLSAELLKNKNSIINTYVALKAFAAQEDKTLKSAKQLQKQLQGQFDNVPVEIQAIIDRLKGLTFSLRDVQRNLKLKIQTDNANNALEKQAEQQKKIVDQQVEFLSRGQNEATQQYLQNVGEAAKAQIDFQKTTQEETNNTNRALQEYRDTLSSVQSKIAQAKKAQQEGDRAGATVLLDQAKNLEESASNQLLQLASLEKTIDVQGNKAPALAESLIKQLESQNLVVGKELVNSIQDVRGKLLLGIKDEVAQLEASATALGQALTNAATEVDLLSRVNKDTLSLIAAQEELLANQVEFLRIKNDSIGLENKSAEEKAQISAREVQLANKLAAIRDQDIVKRREITDIESARIAEEIKAKQGIVSPVELSNVSKQSTKDIVGALGVTNAVVKVLGDTTQFTKTTEDAKKAQETEPAKIPVTVAPSAESALTEETNKVVGSIESKSTGIKTNIVLGEGGKAVLESDLKAIENKKTTATVQLDVDNDSQGALNSSVNAEVQNVSNSADSVEVPIIADPTSESKLSNETNKTIKDTTSFINKDGIKVNISLDENGVATLTRELDGIEQPVISPQFVTPDSSDFSTVTDRLKAQTEAAVKANQALVDQNSVQVNIEANTSNLDNLNQTIQSKAQFIEAINVPVGFEIADSIVTDTQNKIVAIKDSFATLISTPVPIKVGLDIISVNDVSNAIQGLKTQLNTFADFTGIDNFATGFSNSIKNGIETAQNLINTSAISVKVQPDTNSLAATQQQIVDKVKGTAVNVPITATVEPKIDQPSLSQIVGDISAAIAGFDAEGLTTKVATAISNAKAEAEAFLAANPLGVTPEAKFSRQQVQEALQELNGLIISVTVKPRLQGGAEIQQNASGGYIRGPGTGTSDSILSWLSNGEYVMDSFTVGFFGSKFFSNLQSYARTKSKGGLPAFANGGPVNVSPTVLNLSGSQDSGTMERMEILIKSDRGSSRVTTDRESARKLVDILGGLR